VFRKLSTHVVVGIDLAPIVGRPLEIWVIARRAFEPTLIQINHIAALLLVVSQGIPRQRMLLLAHSEKAAERHGRVNCATAFFVDHDVMHAAEFLACRIIYVGTLHLAGCDNGAVGNLGIVYHISVFPSKMDVVLEFIHELIWNLATNLQPDGDPRSGT
jgi:hypothetical protein